MKYKTFTIEPVYYIGSDFRIADTGVVHNRKQTKADVEYYQIYEQAGEQWIAEFTIPECKQTIDNFLGKLKARGLTL